MDHCCEGKAAPLARLRRDQASVMSRGPSTGAKSVFAASVCAAGQTGPYASMYGRAAGLCVSGEIELMVAGAMHAASETMLAMTISWE